MNPLFQGLFQFIKDLRVLNDFQSLKYLKN